MKTAISLPDNVYQAAERIQRRKRMSRSEFYTNAIRWYVEKEDDHGITDQLNKVYSSSLTNDVSNETVGIFDLPGNDWK